MDNQTNSVQNPTPVTAIGMGNEKFVQKNDSNGLLVFFAQYMKYRIQIIVTTFSKGLKTKSVMFVQQII